MVASFQQVVVDLPTLASIASCHSCGQWEEMPSETERWDQHLQCDDIGSGTTWEWCPFAGWCSSIYLNSMVKPVEVSANARASCHSRMKTFLGYNKNKVISLGITPPTHITIKKMSTSPISSQLPGSCNGKHYKYMKAVVVLGNIIHAWKCDSCLQTKYQDAQQRERVRGRFWQWKVWAGISALLGPYWSFNWLYLQVL